MYGVPCRFSEALREMTTLDDLLDCSLGLVEALAFKIHSLICFCTQQLVDNCGQPSRGKRSEMYSCSSKETSHKAEQTERMHIHLFSASRYVKPR